VLPTQLTFDELPLAQHAALPLCRQLSPWLQQALGVWVDEAVSQELVLDCEEDGQLFVPVPAVTVSSPSVPVAGLASGQVGVLLQPAAPELPISVSSSSITTTVAETDTDIEPDVSLYLT
jgi:hypothetical protein